MSSDRPLPLSMEYGDYSLPGATRHWDAIPEPTPLVVGGRYQINFLETIGGPVVAGAELVLGVTTTTDACVGNRP